MLKAEFTEKLRRKLSSLPQAEIEESIIFYSEMIDDRIEEGLSEEEAVCAVGSVDSIAASILSNTPPKKAEQIKAEKKRSMRPWEIALLIIGSPIWLSLLIAVFAVLLSLFIVLYALVISLWAVGASLGACALAAGVAGTASFMQGNWEIGVATVGAGLVFLGLCVFLFFASLAATRGAVILTKKTVLSIKKLFCGKEESK